MVCLPILHLLKCVRFILLEIVYFIFVRSKIVSTDANVMRALSFAQSILMNLRCGWGGGGANSMAMSQPKILGCDMAIFFKQDVKAK